MQSASSSCSSPRPPQGGMPQPEEEEDVALGVPSSPCPSQQPSSSCYHPRKVIIPPAGLYVKRHKVRRRVVELQAPPVLPPEVLHRHRQHVDDGLRAASAGLEQRVESRERERLAKEGREREEMLRQIREASEKGSEFVDRFYRAEHLFQPRHINEHKDVTRESKLYLEARDLLMKDPRMRVDYSAMHVGEVHLRPKTSDERAEEERAQRYINRTSKRLQDFQQCSRESDRSKKLAGEAVCLSEEARALQEKVDGADIIMSFEAKANARRSILELKAKAADLLAESEAAAEGLARIKRDMEQQQREEEEEEAQSHGAPSENGSLSPFGSTQRASVRHMAASKRSAKQKLKVKSGMVAKLMSTTSPLNRTAKMMAAKPSIVAWFVAMASREGVVERLYHGAFSSEDEPPTTGWLSLSPLKSPNEVRKECRVILRSNEVIKSPAVAMNKVSGGMIVRKYTVIGSEIPEVNGTYTESGKTDGVTRFTSLMGISIFRRHLREIPELGITAASVNDNTTELTDRHRENMEEPATLGFDQLYRVATRMRTMDTVNRGFRKQEQRAEAEIKKEENFQLKLRQASEALKMVAQRGGSHGEDGDGDPSDALVRMADDDDAAEVAMLQIPNTTFQTRPADIQLKGADILIPSAQKTPPPLCMKWVFLSCPREASVCIRRHYYVTESEKLEMVSRRQRRELVLEMAILKAITEREVVHEQVMQEAASLRKRFLHETSVESSTGSGLVPSLAMVAPMLHLLDRIRLATVRAVEAIDAWRVYVKRQREALALMMRMEAEKAAEEQQQQAGTGGGGASASSAKTGDWVVTLTVAGPELYGPSPHFVSRFKRFQRGEQPPKRSLKVVYLGMYPNKVQAARAYDLAMEHEAARLKLPVNRMPQKQFRLRPCGRHFAVDTEGTSAFPCEQCLARELDGVAELSPIYVWNGQNYLLKMARDLDRLGELDPLRLFLGPSFAFEGNPLMLHNHDHHQQLQSLSTQGHTISSKPGAAAPYRFGMPTAVLSSLASNVNEWHDKRAWGTTFAVSERDDFMATMGLEENAEVPVTCPSCPTTEPIIHEVEMLSLERVRSSESILQQEALLATMLRSSKMSRSSALKTSVAAKISKPSKSGIKGESIPRYRPCFQMIEKDAEYAHLGAKLIITQTRYPLPFRDPQMWCRWEEGEWKGLSRGRAFRSIEFKIKLDKESRKKSKYLKRIGAELAREISKHFLKADFDKIFRLMAIGEKIGKGTALDTELYNAKMYLLRCEGVFRIAKFVQRRWRGLKGRERAAERRSLLLASQRHKALFDKTVAGTATDTVKAVVRVAASKAAAYITSAVITTFAAVERQFYVVSVRSLEHTDYMHQSMHRAEEEERRCASCHEANPSMAFNLAAQKFHIRFPPCTCAKVRQPERLLLSYYEPVESKTRIVALTEETIRRKLLEGQAEGLVKLSTQLTDACRLKGSSGGMSDQLLGYSETIKTKGGRFIGSKHPNLGRWCYLIGASSKRGRDRWEPLREARVLEGIVAFARTMSQGAEEKAAKARAVATAAEIRVQALARVQEHACMYYEDTRVRFLAEVDAWQAAIKGTYEALEFARRGLVEFEEDVSREDWRQDWDPFENGNNWVQLRYKRYRERTALAARRESIEAHLASFNAGMDYDYAQWECDKVTQAASRCTQEAKEAWEVRRRRRNAAHYLLYAFVSHTGQEAQRLAREMVQAIIRCLVIRRLPTMPVKEVVLFRDPCWVKVSDGLHRNGREFRKAWNLVRRRLMRIQAPYGYDPNRGAPEVRDVRLMEKQQQLAAAASSSTRLSSSSRQKRKTGTINSATPMEHDPVFVVSILLDPLTGHVLIRAYRMGAGDSKEINISPQEMKSVLSSPHAKHLLQPIVLPESDFHRERRAQAERLSDICDVIMEHLKLDIYGQLTIGTIAFTRKVFRLSDALDTSAWWRDLTVHHRSSGKGSEVHRGCFMTGGRFLLYAVYEKYGDLLLEGYNPIDAQTYVHHLPLRMLLHRLLAPPPWHLSLLSALLDSVRLNHYPTSLLATIIHTLDLKLPGENGQWYRYPFPGEVPTFFLRPFGDGGYTKQIYRIRRFLSSRAVYVTFRESGRGGLLIIISRGDFGPTAFRYRGKKLRMQVDLSAVRRFLVGTGCSQELEDLLLRPDQRPRLYEYVLERLVIVESKECRPVQEQLPGLLVGPTTLTMTGTTVPRKRTATELKAAESATRAFDLLHSFARWAARHKVPMALSDMLAGGTEAWFSKVMDEARNPHDHDNDNEDDELVQDLGNGLEEVLVHSLRLRRDPDPDDSKLLVCEQAMSIPEQGDVWRKDSQHVVVQVMLEGLIEDEGRNARIRLRVRAQTDAEMLVEREAIEGRRMEREERETRHARSFWESFDGEQRVQEERAASEARTRDALVQAMPIHNRLTNQLELSRSALERKRAAQCLEQVQRARELVPMLVDLLRWTNQRRMALRLELPGRPVRSATLVLAPEDAAERLSYASPGPPSVLDRRRAVSKVGESCMPRVVVLGTKAMKIGGGGPRCLVDAYMYTRKSVLVLSVYNPLSSHCTTLHLSTEGLPMISELLVFQRSPSGLSATLTGAKNAIMKGLFFATSTTWGKTQAMKKKVDNPSSGHQSAANATSPRAAAAAGGFGKAMSSGWSSRSAATPALTGSTTHGGSGESNKQSSTGQEAHPPLPLATTVQEESQPAMALTLKRSVEVSTQQKSPSERPTSASGSDGADGDRSQTSGASSPQGHGRVNSTGSSRRGGSTTSDSKERAGRNTITRALTMRKTGGFDGSSSSSPTSSLTSTFRNSFFSKSTASSQVLQVQVLSPEEERALAEAERKRRREALRKYWETVGFDRARLKQLAHDVATQGALDAWLRTEHDSLHRTSRTSILEELQSRLRSLDLVPPASPSLTTGTQGMRRRHGRQAKRMLTAITAVMAAGRLNKAHLAKVRSARECAEEEEQRAAERAARHRSTRVSLRLLYAASNLISRFKARRAKQQQRQEAPSEVDEDEVDAEDEEGELDDGRVYSTYDDYAKWLAPCLVQSYLGSGGRGGNISGPDYDERCAIIATLRVTMDRAAQDTLLKLPTSKMRGFTSGQPGSRPLRLNAWVLWLKLLTLHCATCRLPPSACPVLLCGNIRQTTLLDADVMEMMQADWERQQMEAIPPWSLSADATAETLPTGPSFTEPKGEGGKEEEDESDGTRSNAMTVTGTATILIGDGDSASASVVTTPLSIAATVLTPSSGGTDLLKSSADKAAAVEATAINVAVNKALDEGRHSTSCLAPYAVQAVERLILAHYHKRYKPASLDGKAENEDDDDDGHSTSTHCKTPVEDDNVSLPKALRHYVKGPPNREPPIGWRDLMARRDKALEAAAREGPHRCLVAEFFGDYHITPVPVTGKKGKGKGKPGKGVAQQGDQAAAALVIAAPSGHGGGTGPAGGSRQALEAVVTGGDMKALLGVAGVDARGMSVETTWEALQAEGFNGGTDLFTYLTHRVRLPVDMEQYCTGSLRERTAALDRTHWIGVRRLNGGKLRVMVKITALVGNQGVVVRVYNPEVVQEATMVLDLQALWRALPRTVMEKAMKRKGEHAPGSPSLADTPTVVRYLIENMADVVGVRREGACRMVLFMMEDEASRKRGMLDVEADEWRRRNMAQAARDRRAWEDILSSRLEKLQERKKVLAREVAAARRSELARVLEEGIEMKAEDDAAMADREQQRIQVQDEVEQKQAPVRMRGKAKTAHNLHVGDGPGNDDREQQGHGQRLSLGRLGQAMHGTFPRSQRGEK